jgi:chromosome segregation ATPase
MVAAKPNPIRRVVGLLQEMQKEIEAEVAKEKKQWEKFQCFCKKNDGALDKKAKEAAAVIKKTQAEVESLTGQKKQLAEELKKHKKDRKDAEKNLADATKKRAEEKAKFDEATKDVRKTLEDIDRAIAALEKGMGKSFLQTGAAAYLKNVIENNASTIDTLDIQDQQTLMAFLQSGKDYAPAGGEIVGILKMMKDNFDESLGGILGEEEAAVKSYNKMKITLEDLIKTSGRAIEKKSELKGEVAVKIVEAKNLVATTEKQMGDDMATLAELKEACSGKGDEFATRQADAAAEVDAIGQAIGVLNNDDALQLFNKTDTKALAQTSLLQTSMRKNSPVAAVNMILNDKDFSRSPAIAMLAYSAKQALKSKKVDFSKIIKMIDDMVVILKKEGEDDVKVREDCNNSFNEAEAEEKELSHDIEGLTAEIDDQAGVVSAQTDIIAKAKEDIAAAKEAMAEATEQRKADNAEFVVAVDLNNQAVELIQKAKDKLNTYYNPQLVTTEAPVAPSDEDQIVQGAGFQEGAALVQKLPDGAPEVFSGDRKNKGQKGASVLALMDMLANDLNKDTQAMEHAETVAQKDYEKLSEDLARQTAESTKAQSDAEASKASAEEAKLTAESTLDMKNTDLTDLKQTVADLHAKCDFILEAFEERKAARENEVAGLTKAKAILSGAKFD